MTAKDLFGLCFLVLFVFNRRATASDTNEVYKPCQDTTVRRDDGFSFGLVTSRNASFYYKNIQLSPCDKRLNALSGGQVAVFRPKVDEISLLVINISQFNPQSLIRGMIPVRIPENSTEKRPREKTPNATNPENFGGYAVAYAGSRYAAVSTPVFLANGTYHVTSLSLVLNFDKGRLINLLWKHDKCASCSERNTTFVCLNGEQCAIRSQNCLGNSRNRVDCSLSIQTTFSGTDKYQETLTSWYQLDKLHQYSLYAIYSNLKNTLVSQFRLFF